MIHKEHIAPMVKLNLKLQCYRPFNKYLAQRGFSKNRVGDLLPALRFLGGLYNFCNFVIIFSLI